MDTKENQASETSVKRGVGVVLMLIVVSLLWYLTSDRYTPYTSQARVQGFVVGVASKVAGVITKVHVKNNQEVKAGQVLFEVDRANYEIALKKIQSDLESVKRQIGAGSAGIQTAQANLRAAEANKIKAEQDAKRQERLYRKDSGAISVRRLEIARASAAQAIAKVAAAEAEIQRATEQKGGEGEDNAQLKKAKSAVEKAELDLRNTQVVASANGVISDLRADVGQFASAGKPVMTLIAIHDIWISAEFTENNLGNIRVGTPVEIVVDALPGEVFVGKVHSVGLGVAAGQAQPPGNLPSIQNNRDWLRQSQRFPVVIKFDPGQREQLENDIRIGGQAEVIAYSENSWLLKYMGKFYIRVMSWFSYAY
ncbi:MAG: hemolysin D [Moraxellaceae bacterium]|nr:MAG: hemolysin D [Moraxellaceae bacterium]